MSAVAKINEAARTAHVPEAAPAAPSPKQIKDAVDAALTAQPSIEERLAALEQQVKDLAVGTGENARRINHQGASIERIRDRLGSFKPEELPVMIKEVINTSFDWTEYNSVVCQVTDLAKKANQANKADDALITRGTAGKMFELFAQHLRLK